MKKSLLLIPSAVLLLAVSLSLKAADKPKKDSTPFVPRHEVSIQISASYNSFLYWQGNPNRRFTPDFEVTPLLTAFPLGVEYTYHFNKHWGITTGFGAHAFSVEGDGENDSYYSIEPGRYALQEAPVPIGYVYTFSRTEFSFSSMYLSVPVLAQYLHPLDAKGKWNLYAQAGFRAGFQLLGNVDDDVPFFDGNKQAVGIRTENDKIVIEPMGEVTKMPSKSGSLDVSDEIRPFNLFCCVEAGVRFPIYRAFGIYAGAYVDLGVIRSIRRTETPFYKGEDHLSNSLFKAPVDWPVTTRDGDSVEITASDKPMIKGILPFSAGLKFKFAF